MGIKVDVLKFFVEIGFYRMGNVTKDINEELLDWASCADANTLRWILTHLNQELHVYLPRMLGGTVPDDWPEDYIENSRYSLEKIMGDLESGKRNLLGLLDATKDESLNVEVDLFMGKKPLQFYVTLMISEIIHHEGQIAAIVALDKRIRG